MHWGKRCTEQNVFSAILDTLPNNSHNPACSYFSPSLRTSSVRSWVWFLRNRAVILASSSSLKSKEIYSNPLTSSIYTVRWHKHYHRAIGNTFKYIYPAFQSFNHRARASLRTFYGNLTQFGRNIWILKISQYIL